MSKNMKLSAGFNLNRRRSFQFESWLKRFQTQARARQFISMLLWTSLNFFAPTPSCQGAKTHCGQSVRSPVINNKVSQEANQIQAVLVQWIHEAAGVNEGPVIISRPTLKTAISLFYLALRESIVYPDHHWEWDVSVTGLDNAGTNEPISSRHQLAPSLVLGHWPREENHN